MAAKNFETTESGRKNFYNIVYGGLSTRVKEIPEGFEEVDVATLKSKVQKVEEIDLRKIYVLKSGDYPYMVYYKSLEGQIRKLETVQRDGFGKSLNIEFLDTDGDTSIVSVGLYTKYTENILNRLCSLRSVLGSVIEFTPYSIPNEFDGYDGNRIKQYNQGVSIKLDGEKIAPKFKNDDPSLPPTERVLNTQGEETTSRVKRINFLLGEVNKILGELPTTQTQTQTANVTNTTQQEPVMDVEDDDLPF